MVAVAMKTNSCRFVDVCLSDWLPCSKMVKGVGVGVCVKNFRGKIIICSRFSDVSILEFSICEKVREERVVDYACIREFKTSRVHTI